MQAIAAEASVAVGGRSSSFTEAVRALEVQLLQRALGETKYNQRKAAQLLGLTYHQFRALYRKYRTVFESRP